MNPAFMPAGPEMDKAIAAVFGWEIDANGEWSGFGPSSPSKATYRPTIHACNWKPSTNREQAMDVMAKIAPIVGNFKSGDGFLHLVYAEDACHSLGDHCEPKRTDEDYEQDPEPWSCHIHIGMIDADGGCPEHWDHGDRFCARGSTAPLAICRAVLLAWTKP